MRSARVDRSCRSRWNRRSRRSTRLLATVAALAVGLGATSAHAGELEVVVNGTRDATILNWGLYAGEREYDDEEQTQGGRVPATGETTTFVIPDVAAGRYSLAFFLDVDGNGEFDQNWLGLPKEPFGFSNDALGRFGKPSFEATSFAVGDGTTRIELTLIEL